jgi:hypothetical protein
VRDHFLYVLLSLFLIFCTPGPVSAQNADFVSGKVIDKSTSEAVPFATIILKKNQIGLYANADGDFQIIRNPAFRGDTIVITCIGYNRTTLPFNDLKDKTLNRLLLTPSMFNLNEIKVVGEANRLDADAMIARAINNLKENYPQIPFSFVSYYRDYQKRDSDYLNLNEAIVLTYDNGFNFSSANNKYRLMDFRKNSDFPNVNIPYNYSDFSSTGSENKFIPGATLPDVGGNELLMLMVQDPFRNYKTVSFSFVNTLSRDFVKNHRFEEMTPVLDHNVLLFKINFQAITKLTGPFLDMEGNIYIEPKDYSIHKLEYTGYYVNQDKEKKRMFNIKIEYDHRYDIDSLMYLKYISFSNMFKAIDPTDSSYFRVTKTYYDPADASSSTLVFSFNNKINKESAKNFNRYKILFSGVKAKIKNIRTADSSVYVTLDINKNSLINKLSAGEYSAEVEKIKDVKGRILNTRKYIDFYQFRELFVEDYNKTPTFRDGCYMVNKPLYQNCVSKTTDARKYWMNSPINTKTSR